MLDDWCMKERALLFAFVSDWHDNFQGDVFDFCQTGFPCLLEIPKYFIHAQIRQIFCCNLSVIFQIFFLSLKVRNDLDLLGWCCWFFYRSYFIYFTTRTCYELSEWSIKTGQRRAICGTRPNKLSYHHYLPRCWGCLSTLLKVNVDGVSKCSRN